MNTFIKAPIEIHPRNAPTSMNAVTQLQEKMGSEIKMDISIPAQLGKKDSIGQYEYMNAEQNKSVHSVGMKLSEEIAMHLGSVDGKSEMIFEDVDSETQILSLFRYIEQFGSDTNNELIADLPKEDNRQDILQYKALSHSIDNLFHFFE